MKKLEVLCALGLLTLATSSQAGVLYSETFDSNLGGWAGVNGSGTFWVADGLATGNGAMDCSFLNDYANKALSASGLAGLSYTLEFDAIGMPGIEWQGTVYDGGGTLTVYKPIFTSWNVASTIVVPKREAGPVHYSYSDTFLPTEDVLQTLAINVSQRNGGGIAVDNIKLTIAEVPEPSSLLFGGLAGLMFLARRVRK
jgi:hypothetical protein